MSISSSLLQQPLALATAQIHRSRSLGELQRTFLQVAPRFVPADAYGLYLFDDKLQTRTVITHRANTRFISEYEKIREQDPLFDFLLHKKKFTHSLAIFDRSDWLRTPLHEFLSRWGLDYSIEAPLLFDDKIVGTINFAIGGKKYFPVDSLSVAQFLCAEFDATYKRILETDRLQAECLRNDSCSLARSTLSGRAEQVLELLLGGLANRAIASRLSISENTVRHHIKHIYRIFDVHNRAQLAKYAFSPQSRTEH